MAKIIIKICRYCKEKIKANESFGRDLTNDTWYHARCLGEEEDSVKALDEVV